MLKRKKNHVVPKRVVRYDVILNELVDLLESSRRTSARAINAVMTTTYWQIGRRIVQSEQAGLERAEYGTKLLQHLSGDLTDKFGRGFSVDNLELMRRFYSTYPTPQNSEMPSRNSPLQISETASRKSGRKNTLVKTGLSASSYPEPLSIPFPLPWSHYVRLISLENPHAREFYETEALRGGWTVKQLERQINSSFYERTAMSRNKAAMLTKHNRRKREDEVTAEEEIKHPLILEFIDAKDEFSETKLEDALIKKLEAFLLELGNDFTFIGRQRRLRLDNTWYRVDLLLFHRRLRCLVIIDLKTGKFTHADAGQMHLYCNYAKKHWTNRDENPPVGLILCTEKSEAVAHYALDGLPSKIMAAQYKTALPDEKRIAAEMAKTRLMLESRGTRL